MAMKNPDRPKVREALEKPPLKGYATLKGECGYRWDYSQQKNSERFYSLFVIKGDKGNEWYRTEPGGKPERV